VKMFSRTFNAALALALAWAISTPAAANQSDMVPTGIGVTAGATPIIGCTNGYFLFSNSGAVGCAASPAPVALPQALSGGVSGGIAYFDTTSDMRASALLTQHALMLGGGSGAAPYSLSSLGTLTTVLHGSSSGDPSFAQVTADDMVTGAAASNIGTGGVTPSMLASGAAASNLGYTPLAPANDLSDLASAATARTNLGLGSAATQSSSAFLQPSNNLSDLSSAATARTNLGLGFAATQPTTAFLQPSNNLSDVSSAATARTNLGLGPLAIASPAGYLYANGSSAPSASQTIPGGSVTFSPPGGVESDLQTRGLNQVLAQDYGASGSGTTTTGSITGSAAALTVGSSSSYKVGEGVVVIGAGAAVAAGSPTISAAYSGAAGDHTIQYKIASLDANGGVGSLVTSSQLTSVPALAGVSFAATTTSSSATIDVTTAPSSGSICVGDSVSGTGVPSGATISATPSGYCNSSTGNYTLSANATASGSAVSLTTQNQAASNKVTLTIGLGSGAAGWVLAASVDGGAYAPINVGNATSYVDTGYVNPYPPLSIGATLATANDWCRTTVSAIPDGAHLTLSANCPTTVSGAKVYHDDSAALASAASSNSTNGAAVLLPCGTYNLFATVTLTNESNLGFQGMGRCTTVNFDMIGDAFDVSGHSGGSSYGNFLNDFMVGGNPGPGLVVNGNYVSRFRQRGIYMTDSCSGELFDNFNDVLVQKVTLSPNCEASTGFTLMSDATTSSNVFTAEDITVQGNVGNADYSGTSNGVHVDGNVATVVIRNPQGTHISGPGMLIDNAIGASSVPYIINIDHPGFEYSLSHGYDLEAGFKIKINDIGASAGSYLNGPSITGSCAASAGVYIANSNAYDITLTNGQAFGASGDGVYINRTDVALNGAGVYSNSAASSGGTTGEGPGVEIGPSAVNVAATGNIVGSVKNNNWQAESFLIDPGATGFVVSENAVSQNAVGYVVNNAGRSQGDVHCNAGMINDCYPTLYTANMPFILPSSGTVSGGGSNVAATVTFTAALDLTYPNAYVYLPANAIFSGMAAGWYYATCSSTTVCTVYNNAYSSGNPTVPSSPATFSTVTNGSYTQTTGSVIGGPTWTVPANQFGPYDGAEILGDASANPTTSTKTVSFQYGGQAVTSDTVASSTAKQMGFDWGFKNNGIQTHQTVLYPNGGWGGAGTSTSLATTLSVNTATSLNLTGYLELNTAATDWVVLQHVTVRSLPGIN
jgi:hypothetical protein